MGGCFALVARAAEGDHNVADAKPSPTEELARSATHHRIERCPALRPEPSGLRGGGSTGQTGGSRRQERSGAAKGPGTGGSRAVATSAGSASAGGRASEGGEAHRQRPRRSGRGVAQRQGRTGRARNRQATGMGAAAAGTHTRSG